MLLMADDIDFIDQENIETRAASQDVLLRTIHWNVSGEGFSIH